MSTLHNHMHRPSYIVVLAATSVEENPPSVSFIFTAPLFISEAVAPDFVSWRPVTRVLSFQATQYEQRANEEAQKVNKAERVVSHVAELAKVLELDV